MKTDPATPPDEGGANLFDASNARALDYVRAQSAAEGIVWNEHEWLAVELAVAAGILATVEELEARGIVRRAG